MMNNNVNEGKGVSGRWILFGIVVIALITGGITFTLVDKIPLLIASTATPEAIETLLRPTSPPFLFAEDFQDDKVQGIGFSADPQWKIVVDETGNKVYEIDNNNGSDSKGLNFGVDEWENYRVEYRVRFLDTSRSDVQIRLQVRSQGNKYYILTLDKRGTILRYKLANSVQWNIVSVEQVPFLERKTWYKIRVDLQGEHVKVYYSNVLLMNAEDPHIQKGWVTILASPGTHIQVDDVRVTILERK